jgi:hypothetical protein
LARALYSRDSQQENGRKQGCQVHFRAQVFFRAICDADVPVQVLALWPAILGLLQATIRPRYRAVAEASSTDNDDRDA